MRKLYEELAARLVARQNCIESGNTLWRGDHQDAGDHEDAIEDLAQELPSGSGFDAGSRVDLEESTGEKIVIRTEFHHMNDHGFYTCWTAHKIVVRPSFIGGFSLRISGRNHAGIKDYIHEIFEYVLNKPIAAGEHSNTHNSYE